MRRLHVLLVSAAALLVVAAPAAGHADRRGTRPAEGSTAAKPPRAISVTFTEPPRNKAEMRAIDGCRRQVPSAVSVAGNDIVLSAEGGEPGKWKVTYRAVSSVDGHQTKGSFGFTVTGTKDCSRGRADEIEDQVDAAENPGIIENPDPPDDGGTPWFVWVGGGAVVLVWAAFALRGSR